MSESEGSQPVAEGQGKFTFEEAENFVDRVRKDPSILYREREEARKSLHQLIQTTFKTCRYQIIFGVLLSIYL